jgi:large subunit ribosomal protein L25
MDIPTLKCEPRKVAGSREVARLRRAGKLPAILYGHKLDPVPLTLDYHDVELQIAHGAHVVNLDISGKEQSCLFKDAQYDHLGIKLLHVDFARVDLSETVKVHVTIEFRGQPKGVVEGGLLHHEMTELEVECPASQIPEKIRVDVRDLELDQVLHVKDLTLEPGVTVVHDPETVVAVVREPVAKAAEGEEAAGEEAPAEGTSEEPQVIAKGKAEEEAGDAGA